MRRLRAKPRILADDILVFAQGAHHESTFKQAFDATHSFIEDLGAQLAPSKSSTFSTCKRTRARLKAHAWPQIHSCIQVVLHARDLGSHLNTGASLCAPTLTQRLHDATSVINRIRFTKFSLKFKSHLIRMAGIAKGLYGIESSPACDEAMRTFRTAISNAIAPHSSLRSIDLTFTAANCGKDLDPLVITLVRRTTMLRRMCCKHEPNDLLVREIWEKYRDAGHLGTKTNASALASKTPRPTHGSARRQFGKNAVVPRGPIGLLLESIHEIGASLSADLDIRQHNEVDISVLRTPWQHLGHLVEDTAFRARFRAVSVDRSVLAGAIEIDRELLKDSLNLLSADDSRWI